MLDALQILSSAQAVTASAASTNVFDYGSARDVGAGGLLFVEASINTTFLTLTSLQVALQVSVDNSTFYDLMLSPVVAVADLLTSNPLFRLIIPPRGPNMFASHVSVPYRYMRLYYTVAGSDATAGKIDAWLGGFDDMGQRTNYARNYVAA